MFFLKFSKLFINFLRFYRHFYLKYEIFIKYHIIY